MCLRRTRLESRRRAVGQNTSTRRRSQPAAEPDDGWGCPPCPLEMLGQVVAIQLMGGQGGPIEQLSPYEITGCQLGGFLKGEKRAGPVSGIADGVAPTSQIVS